MKSWALLNLRIFGIALQITDENKNHITPEIYLMLNQDSLLEIFFYPALLPKPADYLINIEFALLPWVGWCCCMFGGLVIVRQWPWQAKKILARASRRLKLGNSIILSIEGQRSHNGQLNPYKKGPVVLAIENQIPIVPFIIKGAWDCLPYGKFIIHPGQVTVILKQKIATSNFNYEDRNSLVTKLRTIAENTLKEKIPKVNL